MKKILSAMLSLSFLSLLIIPVTVSAAGVGEGCTRLGGECDSGLSCNLNLVEGEDAGECAELVSPSGSNYGLTDFTNVGLSQTSDIKGTIANIINIVLGFLGIIAVIIILAGGFKWMTAGGNEDKVAESKQMIIQGVIGLVIIFAAWAIASFVISGLQSATA